MLLGQIWTHKTGCSWRSCEWVWVYFEGQLKLLFSFLPRHTHILIERRKKKYKFIQFDNSHLLDMSTQHAQRYCPSKSLEYRAISHTSLSCHSVTTPRSSLNRSLLSVSCQSSLPHFSACRRSTVPEQPRIPLNDSSAQHATSAADKFGSIPFLSHLLTSSSSQTTFLSLCFSWFSAIISFYTLTLSSIFSCHISVRVSWVKAAKAHTCFCQINLAIKKKIGTSNSWRRDMALTTMSMLPSTCDTSWKQRGGNFLCPSPNVIFWKYPAGCIDTVHTLRLRRRYEVTVT